MVQLRSHEESFTVTMPPVTTPPVKGSRWQDLVFITNGGCVENSSMGSQNEPASYKVDEALDIPLHLQGAVPVLKGKHGAPVEPEVGTNWMSATVETLDQRIIPYIKNICQRDPFTGGVVTGFGAECQIPR